MTRDDGALVADWGAGAYERTAARLAPAARHAVRVAGVTAGDRVVDVGCGTGNAAIFAAVSGAEVVGIDLAERLLGVARARAAAASVPADFVVGDARALPFEDATFDVALSVFGVILIAESERAIAEMARVVRPGGRIAITSWIPGSAFGRAVDVFADAVRSATGAAPFGGHFDWGDLAAVHSLLAGHGARVDVEMKALAFTHSSAAKCVDAIVAHHPLGIAAREALRDDVLADARRRALTILDAGNEDRAAFRATTRYAVVLAHRHG